MSRSRRWNYMRDPGYNPPSDRCPVCTEPSRVWHQGAKTVDGVKRTRWACDHGHEWVVEEPIS